VTLERRSPFRVWGDPVGYLERNRGVSIDPVFGRAPEWASNDHKCGHPGCSTEVNPQQRFCPRHRLPLAQSARFEITTVRLERRREWLEYQEGMRMFRWRARFGDTMAEPDKPDHRGQLGYTEMRAIESRITRENQLARNVVRRCDLPYG